MENIKIKKYHIYSFICVSIVGTLFHFLYEFSGDNLIIASFAPVNESTWEHLKLIFFPMLVSSIIGYFIIGKENSNYICSRTKGILVGMAFIIVFFYTYTGIIGKNIDFLNIISFFIAVFLGEFVSFKSIVSKEKKCNITLAVYILVFFLMCFVIFTYITPKFGIFKDPLTGTYGVFENR